MYRFLFSSKWLGYLLLAAIFAAACVGLGRWQMDRRAETLAEISRVTSNYSAAPVPFAEVKEQFSSLAPEREWTQVELKGSYDVAGQRIVRNRPLNGQPGYEVVVPFRRRNRRDRHHRPRVAADRQQQSRPAGHGTRTPAGHRDRRRPPQAGRARSSARRPGRAAGLH